MSSKHTPGPWVVDGSKITTTGKDRDRVRIAKTLPNNAFGMDETQTANADLLAAAPEMLGVLESIYQITMIDADTAELALEALSDIRAEARAVIAKAKGETQ